MGQMICESLPQVLTLFSFTVDSQSSASATFVHPQRCHSHLFEHIYLCM